MKFLFTVIVLFSYKMTLIYFFHFLVLSASIVVSWTITTISVIAVLFLLFALYISRSPRENNSVPNDLNISGSYLDTHIQNGYRSTNKNLLTPLREAGT